MVQVIQKPAETRKPARILVVDNQPESAKFMTSGLSEAGYETVTVLSAEAALWACTSEQFDLLITEIHLPDKDGWSLMRDVLCTCDTPGIAVSSLGDPESVARSIDAGFSVHLTKPLDMNMLASVVQRILGTR